MNIQTYVYKYVPQCVYFQRAIGDVIFMFTSCCLLQPDKNENNCNSRFSENKQSNKQSKMHN